MELWTVILFLNCHPTGPFAQRMTDPWGEGATEEVYSSSYRDQDNLSEERSLSAFSPSSKSEDMEVAEPKEGSDDGED